jgi:hypothetical protein
MVVTDAGMLAGYRRQIRRRIGDGLQTRLFIHRDGHHRYQSAVLILQCDLLINQQNLAHFGFEFRIASIQIVLLGIPAKANADSGGNANGIPGRRRTVLGA